MNYYVAVWKDPYDDSDVLNLMFRVKDGVVVGTTPFMPWAKGRAISNVSQYFQSAGSEFYEVDL